MVFLKLVWASLRRERALYLLWIFSLALAVIGLLVVDVYRQSLTATLKSQGRKILTADIALSTRRIFNAAEEADFFRFMPGASQARVTEMFAMVTARGESRLALVRFVSEDFPLTGELIVKGRPAHGHELSQDEAWAATDLLTLMDLKPGERIKVGQLNFTLAAAVEKDSSQTFRFGNMAPRVYLPRSQLTASGLVQFGSTLTDTLYATSPQALKLKPKIEAKFRDPGVQVTVPADLEQGSLRVLARLLDFLGLTGLVSLSLGWIGVYYLGRRWLALEMKTTGVLKCVGVSGSQLRTLLLSKLVVILLSGVCLGGTGAWAVAHLLMPLVRDSLPADFELVWSWKNTLLLAAIGPLAGLILLYPPVSALAFEKPLALFRERLQIPRARGTPALLLSVASLFLALTYLQAHSWRVTGTFIAGLVLSVVLVGGLGLGFLKAIAQSRADAWPWRAQVITAQWTRQLGASLLLIVVSALAGLLSQLLPHLEKTLVSELRAPERLERPALFMVDIQDEQLTPIKKFLASEGLSIMKEAPLVRARIIAVNDQNFERDDVGESSTREEENDARFRNRGVNLSYRHDLSDSERIIAGKPWAELRTQPVAEIAVEEGYAERLKLKLGDHLKFDVQGVELEAVIASLRKIDWGSFTPNFFIQFPDGVLNDAPKTWIMAIKAHPQLPPTKVQTRITRQFPNVTSINVSEALENATDLIRKLSAGLQTASRLSLVLGVFVFLMILMFQLISARRDWRQLMVLGLTTRQVWSLQVLNYGGLCLFGTVLGGALSFAVAWGLFRFAFDSRVEFDFAGSARVWLAIWGTTLIGLAGLGWRESRTSRQNLSTENLKD